MPSVSTCWLDGLGVEIRHRLAGDVRTRCLEAGDGDVIVVLHGIEASAENHIRNLNALGTVGRVVAPDLLGHAHTDKPDVAYDVADYGRHVLDLMDGMGVERFSVVGQSLGGWISCWLAVNAPERVQRVVLNTAAGLPVREQAHWDQWARLVEMATQAVGTLDPVMIRRRLEWVVKDPASITDELVELRRVMWSRPGWSDIAGRVIGLLTPERYTRQQLDATFLGRLEAPTLLVWTADNPIHGLDAAREAQQQIRRSDLAVVPDAAHWPQFEQPAAYNAAVIDFLTATT